MPPSQQFCDLDRIQRGAFAQVVGHAPQRQAALHGRVFAHAADVSRAITDAFDRGYIAAVFTLIDQHHAGGFAQDILGLFGAQLVLELDIDRFAVADENRHPHASGGDLDLGVHDLLGFDHHLPFFLGRSVIQEAVDMRDHIERDLLGELHRHAGIANKDVAALLEQFVHSVFARARHRLIGGDHHALDLCRIVQGFQHHDHLRG